MTACRRSLLRHYAQAATGRQASGQVTGQEARKGPQRPRGALKREQWPQLVTYLNLPDISRSLGTPLENWVIQLSKSEPDGFDGREWKAVFLSSSRHKGYAFQWFALVAACIVMWIFIGFKKTIRK